MCPTARRETIAGGRLMSIGWQKSAQGKGIAVIEPDPVQQRTEIVDAGPAEAFAGLFDLSVPNLSDGAELPLLWHWLYLLERPAQHALGADGHALTGIPRPRPGRRRMHAGGRLGS